MDERLKFNMYNGLAQLDSTAAWMDVAAGGAGRADHATTWACSKQAPNLQSDCGQTIIILQRHRKKQKNNKKNYLGGFEGHVADYFSYRF